MSPAPIEQRFDFSAYVRRLILDASLLPELARLGAAQSALETGWGDATPGCNLFGIKPVGSQPHVPGRPEIRFFESNERCIWSWLYLVKRSKLPIYADAREHLIRHLVSLQVTGAAPEVYRAAWQTWFLEFARGYCPARPDYGAVVLKIAREQDDLLGNPKGNTP